MFILKQLLILLVGFLPLTISAQSVKEVNVVKNILSHNSNNGQNIKIVDIDKDFLVSTYSQPETSIRLISNSESTSYYFRISKQELIDNYKLVNLFTYEELVEIINSIKKLSSQFDIDKKLDPEYLENKILCNNKINVGYYIKKFRIEWFIELYVSKSISPYTIMEFDYRFTTLFFKDSNDILKPLEKAKQKMELLMQIK